MFPAMVGDIGEISICQSGEDVIAEWRIADFFSLSERDSAWYCSPAFSFGGETWYLEMLPNGWNNCGSSGHVDLHLWNDSSDHPVRQEFSLSLKAVKGEKCNEEHCTKDFDDYDYSHELNLFIPRSELLRRQSELVPDGVLTVVCTMKNTTSAGSDSNTASASAECHPTHSDSGEFCPTTSDSESKPATASDECCHCRRSFDAKNLSSHQNKCMHRPIKCPDCLDVIMLQTWLDEHDCQNERNEGKGLEQNSENTCVEACSQTEEENAENSKNMCVEASTQTGKENADEEFKEKPRNACVDVYTQTVEQNADEVFKEKPRNACVDAYIQTVEQNVSLICLPEKRDLVTDVKDLMKERRGTDVTFGVETPNAKTEFFAHQLILALRSPHFANLFYGQGRNKAHQIIHLKGINTKAFEQMLRHCYDYKPCLRTTEDACALFKVAFEFKVTSLQKLCHTFIRDSKIEPGNVFCILKISEEMGNKSLEDMCYKILQEKTREVVTTYELCDVTPAMVHTILDVPTLSLNSEYELIKWLFYWAKVKSKDEDSSFVNAREYLEKLLQEMNFLALKFEEFAMLCKDYQDFFSSDEIASVSLNIAFPGSREMPDWYDKDLKCRVYTGSKE